MKKLLLAMVLLALLCGAMLLALWFALGPAAHGIHLVINDHEVQWADLNGWHDAAGGLAALFALCIVALVVPLALLLGLLLPLLLALAAALLLAGVALGVGTLALLPLLLPLLLLGWLWRRSRRAAATQSGAGRTTIDA